ncbi:hypothetical protein BZU93_29240 [Salmonella enterica subsp. enterica]|nr:hypothetical protein [Salmonella enterica subsp. enterica serovar Enteritidis]
MRFALTSFVLVVLACCAVAYSLRGHGVAMPPPPVPKARDLHPFVREQSLWHLTGRHRRMSEVIPVADLPEQPQFSYRGVHFDLGYRRYDTWRGLTYPFHPDEWVGLPVGWTLSHHDVLQLDQNYVRQQLLPQLGLKSNYKPPLTSRERDRVAFGRVLLLLLGGMVGVVALSHAFPALPRRLLGAVGLDRDADY